MVASCIKKIKHSLICKTGVYLRDITDMIFVTVHLNVSHQSFALAFCIAEKCVATCVTVAQVSCVLVHALCKPDNSAVS